MGRKADHATYVVETNKVIRKLRKEFASKKFGNPHGYFYTCAGIVYYYNKRKNMLRKRRIRLINKEFFKLYLYERSKE